MRTRRRHACSHVTAGLPEPEQCGASCSVEHVPEGPAGCHLASQAGGLQPHAPCCAAAEQLPHWQLLGPHRGSRVEVSCHPLSLSSLSAAPAVDQLFIDSPMKDQSQDHRFAGMATDGRLNKHCCVAK